MWPQDQFMVLGYSEQISICIDLPGFSIASANLFWVAQHHRLVLGSHLPCLLGLQRCAVSLLLPWVQMECHSITCICINLPGFSIPSTNLFWVAKHQKMVQGSHLPCLLSLQCPYFCRGSKWRQACGSKYTKTWGGGGPPRLWEQDKANRVKQT